LNPPYGGSRLRSESATSVPPFAWIGAPTRAHSAVRLTSHLDSDVCIYIHANLQLFERGFCQGRRPRHGGCYQPPPQPLGRALNSARYMGRPYLAEKVLSYAGWTVRGGERIFPLSNRLNEEG
jgi:hypothetical protein